MEPTDNKDNLDDLDDFSDLETDSQQAAWQPTTQAPPRPKQKISLLFAEKLFILQKQQTISSRELSKRLGVTRQEMERWERGEAMPERETTMHIASIFDVKVDYLLNDDIPIASAGRVKLSFNFRGLSFLAMLVIVFGVYRTIDGLNSLENLENIQIQNRFDPAEIESGMYIEGEIVRADFWGTWERDNRRDIFTPLMGENLVTGAYYYVAKIDYAHNYNITLYVPRAFRSSIEQAAGGGSYKFLGRIVKLGLGTFSSRFSYDDLAPFVGTANQSEIDRVVSPEYALVIVDVNSQRGIYNNGRLWIVIGAFLFIITSFGFDKRW